MSDLPPYPAAAAPPPPPTTKGAAVVRRGTGVRNPIFFCSHRRGTETDILSETKLTYPTMEVVSRASIALVAVICLVLATAFPTAAAMANAPAPAPTSSDGTAID